MVYNLQRILSMVVQRGWAGTLVLSLSLSLPPPVVSFISDT